MTNALDLLLAYPHGLIVTGTVLLILGLIGLALFSPRDVDSAEDPLDDRPKLSARKRNDGPGPFPFRGRQRLAFCGSIDREFQPRS